MANNLAGDMLLFFLTSPKVPEPSAWAHWFVDFTKGVAIALASAGLGYCFWRWRQAVAAESEMQLMRRAIFYHISRHMFLGLNFAYGEMNVPELKAIFWANNAERSVETYCRDRPDILFRIPETKNIIAAFSMLNHVEHLAIAIAKAEEKGDDATKKRNLLLLRATLKLLIRLIQRTVTLEIFSLSTLPDDLVADIDSIKDLDVDANSLKKFVAEGHASLLARLLPEHASSVSQIVTTDEG